MRFTKSLNLSSTDNVAIIIPRCLAMNFLQRATLADWSVKLDEILLIIV